MLDYKQVHLLIEQGVNGLGMFTEQANLHEQVDLIINHTVEKHINNLKDIKSKDYSTIEKNILRLLTKSTTLPLSFNGRYYNADLPDDFGQLSTSYTILGNCYCSDTCCHNNNAKSCSSCSSKEEEVIEEGQYYVAVTKVKYNNKWYKAGELFQGVYGDPNVYGTFKELGIKERDNIYTDIDSLDAFSLSALVKNSLRPLLAYDSNKFYIYYKACGRDREIPLNIGINYIAKYTDALSISWCSKRTLTFPSEIQRFYIDKVIAYIATIDKQEQQNIVNLKSETI